MAIWLHSSTPVFYTARALSAAPPMTIPKQGRSKCKESFNTGLGGPCKKIKLLWLNLILPGDRVKHKIFLKVYCFCLVFRLCHCVQVCAAAAPLLQAPGELSNVRKIPPASSTRPFYRFAFCGSRKASLSTNACNPPLHPCPLLLEQQRRRCPRRRRR